MIVLGGQRRLGADDPHRRLGFLDGGGDTGNQAAAAHGDDDGIHIFQVLEDFEADGALAGHHQRVFEGMHGHVAVFLGDLVHPFPAGSVVAIEENRLCPKGFGVFNFNFWRGHRQHQDGFHPQHARGVGEPLGVIAGRGGDDAVGDLFPGQRERLVQRAANLERPGDLQGFRLEIELATGGLLYLLRT
ncbi:hypothetical protein D3C84_751100 [compost metagenome]